MVIIMNLLDVVKKNKLLRKIFGEKELKIIEKQLLGVILKPSEKTRLSRDIRKKFDAINALIPFVNDFELKHGALIRVIVEEAKEKILNSKHHSNIKRIMLFGSAAEHRLTLLSDIDISVEFFNIGKNEASQFRLDILKKTDERVDMHVYNFLPEKIRSEIDINGRVLYERKNK